MEICNPEGPFRPIWSKIFLISCVCAVSLDPLLFYIPIIHQQNKCLRMDTTLRTVALLSRSVTDFIFMVHFVYKTTNGPSNSKAPQTGEGHSDPKSKISELIRLAREIVHNNLPWLSVSVIIDFFALLPIPQLVIVIPFYNTKVSLYFLEHKKILNIFLLSQYLPRIYRLHLFSNELKTTTKVWIKGLFNFFLYILASHILGAFWYFFSIQRETSCWYQACDHSANRRECRNSFYCDSTTSRNITLLNEHCPLDTPDNASPPFNFGIFLDSLKNHNTEHIKFGKKFFYSFWWGLRNLSNFGTNLTTSTHVWENLFAILISVIGLLLFLYLIGNVQTFMQMEATKSEETRQKNKMMMTNIRIWTKNIQVPTEMRKEIMNSMTQNLKEHKDAHLDNDFFSMLPFETKKSLKRQLCMKPLETVKMLKDMDAKVLQLMCDFLKHVMYSQNSFVFRKGEPLDCMFIIDGSIWTYSTSSESQSGKATPSAMTMTTKTLRKGDIYGEELLNWASDTFSELPICSQHVKSQTKAEVLVLMAKDLATVVSKYQLLWNLNNLNDPQRKKMAASTILRHFRHSKALMSSSSPPLRQQKPSITI
ncbi:PREDICTED: cyclic nucleotide-gated ion channel 1-like [Prunus mume]|uniref:Cyclic nucleotide-gated ion channel 1-like n=1 Tax=Prunus mume TaxID=102107 RepID=A0ABM1LIT6_PRUMU|nr:PREDICTED: cyclic nucleotide-gated ion channel 1-like [Prunus mume]